MINLIDICMLFVATLGIFSMILLMISPFFNDDEKKGNMKYIGIIELIISVVAYEVLFLIQHKGL